LVTHIDNLRVRLEASCERTNNAICTMPPEDFESAWHWRVLKDCEQYLRKSTGLREILVLKATGKTKTGRINPLKSCRRSLRVSMEKVTKGYIKTDGIDSNEIDRRKSAGECLHCAWTSYRKGAHRVKDSI
jgi:hypothetical protein